MNPELEFAAETEQFINDVLNTLGYNGGDNPRFLLQLMYERLTLGEASKLLADLSKRGRAMKNWKAGLLVTMIEKESGIVADEDAALAAVLKRGGVEPKHLAAAVIKEMEEREKKANTTKILGLDAAIEEVAERLCKDPRTIKRALEGRDSQQLERIKKR
jgi:hypothetical protein